MRRLRTLLLLSLSVVSCDYGYDLQGLINNSATSRSRSSENFITAFIFTEVSEATVTISNEDNTITILVPFGTDITALSPEVSISGVTMDPPTGTPQDFTNPVNYTVTAQNGEV